MSVDLCRMTREEFADAMTAGRWLILPLGTLEAHGPHLPLGSDLLQAEHVARLVARQIGGVVAPGIPYGHCRSTRNLPGTISLSPGTVTAVVGEVLGAFLRHGARKMLVLSGHAGRAHLEAVREAALCIAEQDDRATILVISPYDIPLALPEASSVATGDGHAGALETSVLLATHTALVRTDRLPPRARPRFPPGQILTHPERLFPSGVLGDPRAASLELGERLLNAFVDETVRILRKHPPGGAR